MTANEFGCGMYDNICAVFNRANQIRCREGRVDDQRNAVLMRNLCNRFDVDDIGIRVAEGFNEDCFRVFLNGSLECAFFLRVNKGCRNAGGKRKRVSQKVVSSAVDGLGSYDMFTAACERTDCIMDRCCAGCSC